MVLPFINKSQKGCSLTCITIYCDVSIRSFWSVFGIRCFLRYDLGSTKVCWTKFYATALSRSTFSKFTTHCSAQSFHDVAYLSVTSPVFDKFLSYWQVCLFRNISACSFPRHAFFVSFVKTMKCVYVMEQRLDLQDLNILRSILLNIRKISRGIPNYPYWDGLFSVGVMLSRKKQQL